MFSLRTTSPKKCSLHPNDAPAHTSMTTITSASFKGISYCTNATWQCSSDPECTLLKHVNMISSSVKVVVWTHIANLDHSVKVRIVAPISQLLQHRISKKGQETFYPLQNQNYGKLNSSGMRQTKQAQQLS